jgi:hypothetical protein
VVEKKNRKGWYTVLGNIVPEVWSLLCNAPPPPGKAELEQSIATPSTWSLAETLSVLICLLAYSMMMEEVMQQFNAICLSVYRKEVEKAKSYRYRTTIDSVEGYFVFVKTLLPT